MNSWCCKCQEYTECFIGGSIVKIEKNKRIRITNYSCDKCHTLKESIIGDYILDSWWGWEVMADFTLLVFTKLGSHLPFYSHPHLNYTPTNCVVKDCGR